MNRLPVGKRIEALNMLVEGSSMRSVSRVLGISFNTVAKLLVDAGQACLEFHDEAVRGVTSRNIQCDEIWAFCYAKQRNAPAAVGLDSVGDVWTWVGIDRDSKLVLSWLVTQSRDASAAMEFMDDLAGRLTNRVQLTTDGLNAYLEAVDTAFGGRVDYAQLVKAYGPSPDRPPERRYSPSRFVAARKVPILGEPDEDLISTSHVERHNLTMRMSMRRFTRLTNAFSKRIRNHGYSVALYMVFYNFCRIHRSLGTTPAQAAGLAEFRHDLRWVVEMMNERAPTQRRGPYRTQVELNPTTW